MASRRVQEFVALAPKWLQSILSDLIESNDCRMDLIDGETPVLCLNDYEANQEVLLRVSGKGITCVKRRPMRPVG